MSQDVPRKPPRLRRRYILQNIAQKAIKEIASECGVDEKTIDRDIKKLKESGEWQSWLEDELLRLHKLSDIDNTTKYREIAKLYAKTMIQKTEVVSEGSLKFEFIVVEPNGDSKPNVETTPNTVENT